jgi:hypothetical protein
VVVVVVGGGVIMGGIMRIQEGGGWFGKYGVVVMGIRI